MSEILLQIKNLHVQVEGREIIKGLDLEIRAGETHVLMGPNGAGKSTLDNVIMGHPAYKITEGSLFFKGQDLTQMTTDARARLGLFLSFQTPEEIPGVVLEDFLRLCKSTATGKTQRIFAFRKELQERLQELQMDPSYAERYVNVGFSGGEKKKTEILQLLVLQPLLALLDETDSGLDIDAVRIVSEGIRRFKNKDNALLIITHNAKILSQLQVDQVHVLVDGRFCRNGGPELIDAVNRNGFRSLEKINCGWSEKNGGQPREVREQKAGQQS